MKYKVKALNVYKERNIEDIELKRVPNLGEEWIVNKERKDILLGKNKYGFKFVDVIEEIEEIETAIEKEQKETAVRKTTIKRNIKKDK